MPSIGLPSIGLPSKTNSILEESKDVVPPLAQELTGKNFKEPSDRNESSKIAMVIAEKSRQILLDAQSSGSSESDDSDFDMMEALDKSTELQAYIRE